MPIEILERLIIEDVQLGGLPPFWDDKPILQSLYKTFLIETQQYSDTTYNWINGITISNAAGKNLDDIGYLWDVTRSRRNDVAYRQAILSTMLSASDSGTATDIKRLLKSLTSSPYIGYTLYPNTRYISMRTENSIVSNSVQESLNGATSSGGRTHIYWEPDNESFIPGIRLTTPTYVELGAETGSGLDTISALLGGYTDTLGITSSGGEVVYVTTINRAYLPININIVGTTEVLEAVTSSGEVSMQALEPGGFLSEIELITGGAGTTVVVSGRTLALTPSTITI